MTIAGESPFKYPLAENRSPIATDIPTPDHDQRPVVLITGPTGIGKTEVALELARRRPLEIISADSMQIYRGLVIGTAQPTPDQLRQARFHLCGVLEPTEHCDVKRFIRMADAAHRQILARRQWPLYVGGTGMYLRALRWGLFEGAGRNDRIRQTLQEDAQRQGPAALHARLRQLDPAAADRIGANDTIRLVRALEVYKLTGRRLSVHQRQWENPRARFPHVMVVLYARREWMRQRIAARTRAMLTAGWIREVEDLLGRGLSPEQHCFKALGYRDVVRHIGGEISRSALEELIVIRTRQFAKRQLVWLRRERPAIWLAIDQLAPPAVADWLEKLLEKVQSTLV